MLTGKAKIELRRDAVAEGKKAGRKAKAAPPPEAGDADQSLFQALRARRTALAKAQSVPAYVILPDRSLLDMARRKPVTAAALAEVHGVGEAKLARYGEAFLEVIRGYRGGG